MQFIIETGSSGTIEIGVMKHLQVKEAAELFSSSIPAARMRGHRWTGLLFVLWEDKQKSVA